MIPIPPNLINLSMEPMEFSKRIPMDINFEISHNSRADATGAGAERYFTGSVCSRGHMSDRYTSTGNCVECHVMRMGKRQQMPYDPSNEALIPKCLEGKPTLVPCLKCSRFPNNCKGKTQPTQLARATHAFPDHGHVSARAAREARVTVYRPDEPCGKCGRVSWRNLAGKCGECDADERMPWRAWTEEQKAANARAIADMLADPERHRRADEINRD